MASDSKNPGETPEEEAKDRLKDYERLIKRLQQERKALQEIVDRDYREARRYVRSHPEQGVSIAFISGIAVGYVLGKLGR